MTAALADHPRIGERPTGAGAAAAMSGREQAGVDPADDELRRRLADGNRRYEERFGRIYLVRAAGRSGAACSSCSSADVIDLRASHGTPPAA